MEIYQLEAFEAVARHGSFTRAAESLFLTQPAVTRQIAALETEMKTRLFDRLGRTVRMTAAGEALHRYSEEIIRLMHEAAIAVADVEIGESGRIIVGASNTLATYVLPQLLRSYRELYGARIEIAIHTGASARVLDMVRDGEVDAGLVTGDAETMRDSLLTTTLLADYDTCVVVPPGHKLIQGKGASGDGLEDAGLQPIAASDLSGSPLILMETGTNLRAYVDRLLSAAGVEEQVSIELDNVEAIKRMIEAGLGVSLLPRVAVRAEVEAGTLIALPLADIPRPHRRIALTYRRDKYLTAAVRGFILLLENEMRSANGTAL